MDALIRRLGGAMLALFVVLLAQVTYIQVVASDRLADNPANATRQLIAEYRVDREASWPPTGRPSWRSAGRAPGN